MKISARNFIAGTVANINNEFKEMNHYLQEKENKPWEK